MRADDRNDAKRVNHLRLVAVNDAPGAQPDQEPAAPRRRKREAGGSRLLSSALLPIAAVIGYFGADVSSSQSRAGPTLKAEHALFTLNDGEPSAPLPPGTAGKLAQADRQDAGKPAEPPAIKLDQPKPSQGAVLDKATPPPSDGKVQIADIKRQIEDIQDDMGRMRGVTNRTAAEMSAHRNETNAALKKLSGDLERLTENSDATAEDVAEVRKMLEDIVRRASAEAGGSRTASRDAPRGSRSRSYDLQDEGDRVARERRDRPGRGYAAEDDEEVAKIVTPGAALPGYALRGVVRQVAWLENDHGDFMQVKPGTRLPNDAEVLAIRQFGDVFAVETDQGVVAARR